MSIGLSLRQRLLEAKLQVSHFAEWLSLGRDLSPHRDETPVMFWLVISNKRAKAHCNNWVFVVLTRPSKGSLFHQKAA